MSWTPDLTIGELRPWPDSVYVVRGNRIDSRVYVPEDALIHMELHECPACANVADLQDALAENDRLRELVRDFYPFASGRAANPWLSVRLERMRELGV